MDYNDKRLRYDKDIFQFLLFEVNSMKGFLSGVESLLMNILLQT